jgi:cysteine desulfurase
VPVDVQKIGCDLLTISGHKIHGPQGTGALFVRKGTLVQPLFHGGRHERSRRAGTENLPGIVGLGKAAELARLGFDDGSAAKMAAMRDRLQAAILAQVEFCGVNGEGVPRVPNTTNIWFEFIEGEPMVIALDLKGVSVSTGAACSSGAIEPSHVLTAMGLSGERARASIRFSLGKQTTDEDVDFVIERVPETVAKLRELSPLWKGSSPRSAVSTQP